MVALLNSDIPITSVDFDGNPIDLERTLAHVSLHFLIKADDFQDADDEAGQAAVERKKCAYLLSHFRGPALDWAATVMRDHQDWLASFEGLRERIKRVFGYNTAQMRELASAELAQLEQGADLHLFLARFDELCDRGGIGADVSKITLLRGKLKPPYTNVLLQGIQYNTYGTFRNALIQVYVNLPATKAMPDKRRKKLTCGKCGKKGHTGSQCRTGN